MSVAELTSDILKIQCRGDSLSAYSTPQLKNAIKFLENLVEFHNRFGDVPATFYFVTKLNDLQYILDHR